MRWQMIMHGRRRDRGLANRHRNLIQATDDVARGVQESNRKLGVFC
jgi:hypothetical protein